MKSTRKNRIWKTVQLLGFLLAAGGAISFSVEGAHLGPAALVLGVLVWGFGRFMHWWVSD